MLLQCNLILKPLLVLSLQGWNLLVPLQKQKKTRVKLWWVASSFSTISSSTTIPHYRSNTDIYLTFPLHKSRHSHSYTLYVIEQNETAVYLTSFASNYNELWGSIIVGHCFLHHWQGYVVSCVWSHFTLKRKDPYGSFKDPANVLGGNCGVNELFLRATLTLKYTFLINFPLNELHCNLWALAVGLTCCFFLM